MNRTPPAPCGVVCSGVLVFVAACATSSAPRPSPDQQAVLKDAERLYRQRDPGFAAVRDRLAADPVTALWLTRMFVWDLVRATEASPGDDEQFLRAAIGTGEPVISGAMEQLRTLGTAAVPAVSEDLLRHKFADRRRLGVEVLVGIGAAGLPLLRPLLDDGDWRVRQTVVQVATQIDDPVASQLLERGARDAHFAVRAAALSAVARRGAASLPLLYEALAHDADPFVRRSVATALGAFRDRDTAAALIDYYERALASDDRDGVRAADDSLRQIAGRTRGGDLQFWRVWLAGRPAGEVR